MDSIQSLELALACKKVQKKIGAVIHPSLDIQRFCRSVIVAAKNPRSAIAMCERESLIDALIKCASDGLIPDGVDAAITPYYNSKNNCQMARYMPMVDGIIKHIKADPDVLRIVSECVYENDVFKYEVGKQDFVHEPNWFGERGDMIGVYAFVEKKDGACFFQALNMKQIKAVRETNKSNDVWGKWPEQMAKKTAIRRLHRFFKIKGNIINRDDDLYSFESNKKDSNFIIEPDNIKPVKEVVDVNKELGLIGD